MTTQPQQGPPTAATAAEEAKFDIPSWAGKPPNGLHLDVMKGDKLIQKLMIDEKRCYFFGRNPKLCDFAVDHASCSRVHAVLLWHKHLKRMFLIDLGSTHGTYIGKVLLEGRKPEQLAVDQTFHLGASSRYYTLRERPIGVSAPPAEGDEENEAGAERSTAKLLGLPEKEEELESLTEYNTALNRRIVTIGGMEDEFKPFSRRRRSERVNFREEEDDVINPEDVDPSIGRFRNLVQTAVISAKKPRLSLDQPISSHYRSHEAGAPGHAVTTSPHAQPFSAAFPGFGPISAKLGLNLPNLAPEIDLETHAPLPTPQTALAPGAAVHGVAMTTAGLIEEEEGPKKKKYAKEAWPGKKPGHLLV